MQQSKYPPLVAYLFLFDLSIVVRRDKQDTMNNATKQNMLLSDLHPKNTKPFYLRLAKICSSH